MEQVVRRGHPRPAPLLSQVLIRTDHAPVDYLLDVVGVLGVVLLRLHLLLRAHLVQSAFLHFLLAALVLLLDELLSFFFFGLLGFQVIQKGRIPIPVELLHDLFAFAVFFLFKLVEFLLFSVQLLHALRWGFGFRFLFFRGFLIGGGRFGQ